MAKRLKIAFLKFDSFNEFDSQTIEGLTQAVREGGASLAVFTGQAFYDEKRRNAGISSLYGVIRAAAPDGIVTYAWLPEARQPRTGEFLAAFPGIPVFLMGGRHEIVHHAWLPGREYMRELLGHLADYHGYEGIAYIGSQVPDDRDEAYLEFFRERACLVEGFYVRGDTLDSTTSSLRVEGALARLIDGREPGRRPRAIMVATTDEAARLVVAVKARGLRVPEDVAVASWEDGEPGRRADPPVTGVEYPFRELGLASGRRFIELLRGGSVPLETTIRTRIMYRGSCGCGSLAAALGTGEKGREEVSEAERRFFDLEDELFERLRAEAGGPPVESPFLKRWESALAAAPGPWAEPSLRRVLARLRSRARYPALDGGNPETAPRPPAARDDPDATRDLFEIAQTMIDLTFGRLVSASPPGMGSFQDLNVITLELLAERTEALVLHRISEACQRVRIPSCHIFLPEPGGERDPGDDAELDRRRFRSSLWHEAGSRRPEREGMTGMLRDFLPAIIGASPDGSILTMKVLLVEDRLFGLALFDPGDHDTRTIEALARGASSALNGAWNLKRLEEAQAELRSIAETDPLTGLGNRYSFYRHLNALAEERPADGAQVAVIAIDLNGFKAVNDSFGHGAGDETLKAAAVRLMAAVGDAALGCYRIGGDEFVALAASAGPAESGAMAARVCDGIKSPIISDGRRFSVSASVGCAHYPADGVDPAEVLKYADLCMYRAKERAGPPVVFDSRRDVDSLKKAELANDVLRAAELDQIEVLYQAMFDADREIAGVDALARWRHPSFGLLMPGEFIPVAESCHVIVAIETRVLSIACEKARGLGTAASGKPRFMLVNCSNGFFYSPDFIDIVASMIEASRLPRGALRLGLEERFAFRDPDRAIAVVERLNALGVDFAVEGMGTSSSWIGFMSSLPENTIVKVDRGFVRHVHTSSSDRDFLNRVITLFESRGLTVALSGIEVEDQLGVLKAGDRLFQGYALAEPMEFERLYPASSRGA